MYTPIHWTEKLNPSGALFVDRRALGDDRLCHGRVLGRAEEKRAEDIPAERQKSQGFFCDQGARWM